ncbi:hypothetical protein DP116_13310 [Brasilonema bromeliae SPC951]|uniref:histidine kinase n=2 Tax=Bromeliae group (in: Brasilonema) TaxID=3398495 RepID=A0ABX1P9R0_9CYAN|nr:hypothetical protein [Brasilonema bromeliae SPC951]
MLQAQKMESLGLLAGGIAHDFNNILTGVMGYIDLARAELPADAPARRLLTEAARNTERAADLTRQMLAYSGKGRFVVTAVDLTALTLAAKSLLEVSVSKKCRLGFDLQAGLPACQADATQLEQVLMNLVINGSEALGGAAGEVTVRTGAGWFEPAELRSAGVHDRLPAGEYVWLEVADTGGGMSAETAGKMFDPFFSTKFVGRGLGLAAVLGIVRGHRGAITVDTAPGRGTRVRVLLPAVAGPDLPTPAPAAAAGWRATGTVLVADDEPVVRQVAAGMLERLGFRVVLAADGREAVAAVRAGGVDLVLLDLLMPVMDGREALRDIRAAAPGLPVLLSSGYDEQQAADADGLAGFDGFVRKPYRLHHFVTELRRVYERRPAGGTIPT